MLDGELLYRLILPSNTVYDGVHTVRAATNAFQDYPENRLQDAGVPAVAVSIFLDSVMQAAGTTIDDLLARRGGSYGVATVTAGCVRAEGQGVVRWPTKLDPEHGMIFSLSGAKKSNGQSKRIAKASRILALPPPAPG